MNGSSGGACPGGPRHSSASASVACDLEDSDIYDETWLESTLKVNGHTSSGADEKREKKPSRLYKYVIFTIKHREKVSCCEYITDLVRTY